MMKNYKVVYTSELQQGAVLEDVVVKLSSLFKISSEEAETFLLQKKAVVIKKDLQLETAKKYQKRLSSIGLRVVIKESSNTIFTEENDPKSDDMTSKDSNDAETQERQVENNSDANNSSSLPKQPEVIAKLKLFADIFHRVELNFLTRTIISFIITFAFLSVAILFFNFPTRGEAITFFCVVTIISVYLFTGIFRIENKKILWTALVLIFIWFCFKIFKEVYLVQNADFLQAFISNLGGIAAMSVVVRVFAHLRK